MKKNITVAWGIGPAFLIASSLLSTTAWAAPGAHKLPRQESSEKSGVLKPDLKDAKKAKKPSLKKRLIKKAGTAAAVGVATKKVSSALKPDLKKAKK